MRLILLAFAQAIVLLAAAQKKPAYPDGLYAEVTTSKGLIVLQLEFEKAPLTVSNFVALSEGTIENTALPPGKRYFDGAVWHRVVPGHVIQCGIPANSTAEDPGYSFPNEIVLPDLNHGRTGMVGMANGGAHTNGSQWYITLGDRSYLDGDYTVFGHVVKGLEVTTTIGQEDIIKTIRIVRVGKAASSFHPSTESFKAMAAAATIRIREQEANKKAEDEKYIQTTWPEAKNFLRYVVVTQGEGPRLAPGTKVRIRYKAQFVRGDSFISTADAGKPWFGEVPETFDYEIGVTKINPGFDASVAQMRKGEKRVLIIPSEQAYGIGGYYPPERKGEKRFHVSPNQAIVYEVEIIEVLKP